jgi:hypothetical protein
MALAAAKADSPGAMHTGAADMMSRIVFVTFTSCTDADPLAPTADTGSAVVTRWDGPQTGGPRRCDRTFSQTRLGRQLHPDRRLGA